MKTTTILLASVLALMPLAIDLQAEEETAMTTTPEAAAKASERKVIENVPQPRGANTMIACLTAAVQSQGEDITYDELMGLSSRAFRLQFCWCPSAPHACCGFNTYEPALKAVGYSATSLALACWSPETRRQETATDEQIAAARAAVKASIDGGMPVMCSRSGEGSLIVGYQHPDATNATGWLRRPGPLPEDDTQ